MSIGILYNVQNTYLSACAVWLKLLTLGTYSRENFIPEEWKQLYQATQYLKEEGLVKTAPALGFIQIDLTAKGMEVLDKTQTPIPSSNVFNIGSINAPSIIGSQQNVTQNIGISIEAIAKMISEFPTADQNDLSGLVDDLKDIESSKKAVHKGMLVKYADTMLKYLPLTEAVGKWVVEFLTKFTG